MDHDAAADSGLSVLIRAGTETAALVSGGHRAIPVFPEDS
jgi:hypothetical protein